MCDPTLAVVLSTAAAVTSQAQNIAGQKQAQRDQIAANKRETARRQAEAIAEFGALQAERVEARRKTAEDVDTIRRDERRQRARARTARGEAGVSGLSVDALQRDIAGSAARQRESAIAGLAARETSVERRKQEIHDQTGFRLDNLPRPRGVNVLGGGLQIASALADGGEKLGALHAGVPSGASQTGARQ